ncbi:MAG: vWA domain-containing protein [Planctomycetaceae bacterium]
MTGEDRKTVKNVALDRARQALRLASASLPHLSGLARLVRIRPSRRVPVAAVSSSGLILVHPEVFAQSPLGDAAFVLAHELLHLALNTHGRTGTARPIIVNYAHDYIINDILSEELLRDPPLNGLVMQGAREKSLEELVVELSKGGAGDGNQRCWAPGAGRRKRRAPRTTMGRALEEAGLVEPPPPEEQVDPTLGDGDLLPDDREDEFEPEMAPLRQQLREEIRRAAAKAAGLAELRKQMERAGQPVDVAEPRRGSEVMRALHAAYAAPWELALQRWMDAVSPGERTYARPSRRGMSAEGIVRPGRQRRGWALHIVLDTSGSMVDVLPKALGAIAAFCDASHVSDVHLLQCDQEVTSDLWVEPAQLDEFKITGFGYSDMSPAMNRLAADPDVEAVLVLTDGYIDIPKAHPSYRTLFALIGEYDSSFNPAYGEVLRLGIR